MLQQACLDRVERAFVYAERHYKTPIPRVPVIFNNRLTATAGRAFFDRQGRGIKIDLSTKLLTLNGQEFVDDTPGHEAAHIIASFLLRAFGAERQAKQAPHGAKWKEVMKVIGQEPNRCHSMKSAAKRYTYILEDDSEVHVTPLVHKRIQSGSRSYSTKSSKLLITADCFVS